MIQKGKLIKLEPFEVRAIRKYLKANYESLAKEAIDEVWRRDIEDGLWKNESDVLESILRGWIVFDRKSYEEIVGRPAPEGWAHFEDKAA